MYNIRIESSTSGLESGIAREFNDAEELRRGLLVILDGAGVLSTSTTTIGRSQNSRFLYLCSDDTRVVVDFLSEDHLDEMELLKQYLEEGGYKFTRKEASVSMNGLKCDSPGCSYHDRSILFDDYEKYIDAPCPECGASLLTREDYDKTVALVKTLRFVTKVTGKISAVTSAVSGFFGGGGHESIPVMVRLSIHDPVRSPEIKVTK